MPSEEQLIATGLTVHQRPVALDRRVVMDCIRATETGDVSSVDETYAEIRFLALVKEELPVATKAQKHVTAERVACSSIRRGGVALSSRRGAQIELFRGVRV